MGVFDRFLGKRMSLEEVRVKAESERLACEAASEAAKVGIRACVEDALTRLGGAPEGSLASLVRERIATLNEDMAVGHAAQVVRDGLDLCARSPVSGGVRQLLLGFEKVIIACQEVKERDRVRVEVAAAIARLDEGQAVRSAREDEAKALDAHIAHKSQECEVVLQRKDTLLRTGELVEIKTGLQHVTGERKAAQARILQVFDPALPLFARTEHPLLSKYVDDPVQALASDFSLSVIREAQVLANSLRKEGFLDTVALSQIAGLRQDILAPLVHRYANARREEERLMRALELLPVVREISRMGRDLRLRQEEVGGLRARRSALVVPSDDVLRKDLAARLRAWNVVLV